MSTVGRSTEELLLGEWACLGILYQRPAHGFAVAARLKPDADVGRVWSLSRALTYRSLDQLASRDFIRPVAEEPGIAGGNRTILAATRSGRTQFRKWLATPVMHLRDLRSELLLKLVLAEICEIDVRPMLDAQRVQIAGLSASLAVHADAEPGDVVGLWRSEAAAAALNFLDRVARRPV